MKEKIYDWGLLMKKLNFTYFALFLFLFLFLLAACEKDVIWHRLSGP